MLPVLLAVTGAPWESELVARLSGTAAHGRLLIVRRCVDVADLLAAAASGTARAALVWPGLRRLDGTAIADLTSAGVTVVGVVTAGEEAAVDGLRGYGMADLVAAEMTADKLILLVGEAVARTTQRTMQRTGHGADAVPAARHAVDATPAADAAVDAAVDGDADGTAESGRIVAVWGPTGAPGRTTVAVNVASELARQGMGTLLADVDVYGGVVAELLGIIEDAPGIAAAVRIANAGGLGPGELVGVARQVATDLRVLTGLARADRWPELRPAALAAVWQQCRRIAGLTVVDCGFCLEQDEELSFDTSAPRRNGATVTTLEAADTICVVGTADPIGVLRLVRAINELRSTLPGASIRVVVNRVRPGPIGREPARQVADIVERHTGVRPVDFVPYDPAAFDAAVAAGRVLADVAPASPARAALAELAAALAGVRMRQRARRRVLVGRRR